MPKGAPLVFVLLLVFGAVLLTRQFDQSQSGPLSDSSLSARSQGLDSQPPAVDSEGIAVYFSPHGGCEAAVVDQIESATQTIDMECYSFTSRNISHALVDAQSHGVHVRVIFDKNASTERGSQADFLQNSGIPVYSDGTYAIAHNKVVVIDNKTVVTGSFNFTRQAENSNAENLLVLSNKPLLAQAYESNFAQHLGHSDPYEPGQAQRDYRDRQ